MCYRGNEFVQNYFDRSKQLRKMRQVTIYTTDKEYCHFIELAKNLNHVKKQASLRTEVAPLGQELTPNPTFGTSLVNEVYILLITIASKILNTKFCV